MKNSDTKQKFVELRAFGMSYQKIAEDLQVSKRLLLIGHVSLAMS
jgi:orotate phosphoribosyltransferase-like protein